MKKIDEIDKNLAVKTSFDTENIDFFDVKYQPFNVYGVKYSDGRYRRMSEDIAKKINDGVLSLHTNCAGGRVRFVTDSKSVHIKSVMDGVLKMSHIPLAGSAGFDIYADGLYAGTFIPPIDMVNGYDSEIKFANSKERLITVNFPTYSNVKELYIGLEKNSMLKSAKEYSKKKPIVYYGSSITQGGCVSRPGNTYQEIISRRFDCDYINLGFSGSAKGEDAMTEYIAGLEQSVFVMDYDYNAPNVEHLKNTHKKMFLRIREKNPQLPIILLSAPTQMFEPKREERRAIIKDTYEDALKQGDKNVYYICGSDMLNYADADIMTVDGTHPNDFGFWCMAEKLGEVLEKILK